MPPNDADGIANSAEPDQTAPLTVSTAEENQSFRSNFTCHILFLSIFRNFIPIGST